MPATYYKHRTDINQFTAKYYPLHLKLKRYQFQYKIWNSSSSDANKKCGQMVSPHSLFALTCSCVCVCVCVYVRACVCVCTSEALEKSSVSGPKHCAIKIISFNYMTGNCCLGGRGLLYIDTYMYMYIALLWPSNTCFLFYYSISLS